MSADKREPPVSFRLSEAANARLLQKAKAAGMSPGAYAKEATIEKMAADAILGQKLDRALSEIAELKRGLSLAAEAMMTTVVTTADDPKKVTDGDIKTWIEKNLPR